jgi:hypothetical protein
MLTQAIRWLCFVLSVTLVFLLPAGCAKRSLKPVAFARSLDGYAVIRKVEDRIVFVAGTSGITLCENVRTLWEKKDGISYGPCRSVLLDLGGARPNIYVAVGYNPDYAALANYFSFIGGPTQADCDLLRVGLTQSPEATYGWTDVPCRPATLSER